MKIVINKCYGGFGISDEYEKKLGVDSWDMRDLRTDERLVDAVEKDPEGVSDTYAALRVVEIPDEATDYYIDEYDGMESIIYVVDGKLHWT